MRQSVRYRAATGNPGPEAAAAAPPAAAAATLEAPASTTAAEAAAAAAATALVSFTRDIVPMFAPFAAAMTWRFDLGDYGAVKANAATIYGRISSVDNPMPPPPFPMLTAAQIQRFQAWISGGCQP
jgi:3-oxoacyl-ACP reductase-like protein